MRPLFVKINERIMLLIVNYFDTICKPGRLKRTLHKVIYPEQA